MSFQLMSFEIVDLGLTKPYVRQLALLAYVRNSGGHYSGYVLPLSFRGLARSDLP
jgi:hypothetical protein